MRSCPRCGAAIGEAAIACRCGWKDRETKGRPAEPELTVECAHMECQHRAKVKIRTKTGWANLCMFHYDEHYRLKALATCEALGLHTTEQRREWTRNAIQKLVQKWTPNYGSDTDRVEAARRAAQEAIRRGREPGEDDE